MQDEPVTHYQSSKGPRAIADMPHRYLGNAISVIKAQIAAGIEGAEERRPELAAMESRYAELSDQYAASDAANVGVGI